MQFGIFYEHQIPRPWVDGNEHKLFKDALEQVEAYPLLRKPEERPEDLEIVKSLAGQKS